MKKDTLVQGEQFVISYELLHLLHWLLKYEEGELSKLITKSFMKGIKEKTADENPSTNQITPEMQNSIINFFAFMEQEISDISNQKSAKLINNDIVKALDHTDPNIVDNDIVKSTLLKTLNHKTHSKQYFLKELLRQWKPKKEAYRN